MKFRMMLGGLLVIVGLALVGCGGDDPNDKVQVVAAPHGSASSSYQIVLFEKQ